MKKTLALLLTLALAFSLCAGMSVFAAAAEAPTFDDSGAYWRFYANGTPIEIAQSGADVVISWAGGSKTYTAAQAASLVIYGGGAESSYTNGTGHDYDSSSVTLTSGTVFQIVGGGRKQSVTTTNVYINGGSATSVIGGSRAGSVTTSNVTMASGAIANNLTGGGQAIAGETPSSTTNVNVTVSGGSIGVGNEGGIYGGCDYLGTVGTSIINISGTANIEYVNGGGGNTAPNGSNVVTDNVTTSATINVSGGNAAYVLGGGMGYSTTRNTVVNIGGGTVGSAFGSGSNGVTDAAVVNITGGTVTDVSAVVRGTVGSSTINISGGNVSKAYTGSTSETPATAAHTHNGAITGSAALNITGGSVTNAYLGGGFNGSGSVGPVAVPTTTPTSSITINSNVPVDSSQNGTAYGGNATDNSLAAASTLNIAANTTLSVPSGGSLTNSGSVVNSGAISMGSGAKFNNTPTGTVTGGGTTPEIIRLVTDGRNQTRTVNAATNLLITSNGDFADKSKISVGESGGALSDLEENVQFTWESGSIKTTLLKSYLDTLPVGTYVYRVTYADNSYAETNFTIAAAPIPPAPAPAVSHANPSTGFDFWAWITGLFA